MLKESDDLDILGVTFDSKMNFDKHVRSVAFSLVVAFGSSFSKACGITGECSMIDCYLVEAFGVFPCRFGVLISAWCSAADTQLELLDRVVGGTSFLTGGVLQCDIAHRRSVVVLSMLYQVRCNPMHPLYGALPAPYVPLRATLGALVAHQYTYAPPRCGTS